MQERVGLTEGQIQDLMVLQHLFFSRIGQLTSNRIKLVRQMAENSQHLSHVEAWAQQLRQNILDAQQMYLAMVTAIYLGVSAHVSLEHDIRCAPPL